MPEEKKELVETLVDGQLDTKNINEDDMDPNAKDALDKAENTMEFEIEEELQEKLKKKKIKWPLIIGIVAGLILISGALYFFMFRTQKEKFTNYTLKETVANYTFEGTGLIKTDDVATYNLEESETVEFLVGTYPGEGDTVEKDDDLFGYKEITAGDEIERGVKPSIGGIVTAASNTSVTVREGSVSAEVSSPTGYNPEEGRCALIDISGNVEAAEVDAVSGSTPTLISLSLVSPDLNLEKGATGTVYFANEALSSTYNCADLLLEGGKITDIGHHGSIDPEQTETGAVIDFNSSDYENELPETETPGADYDLLSQDGLVVSAGDSVSTSSYLYKWTFVEKVSTNKTIKSLVNGVVKSITLVKEDPDANTGTYEIQIYDTDKNYLNFEIAEEYADKIGVGSTAEITDGETTITADVSDVTENIGSIANANFKNYDLDKEFNIKIEGTGETVVLVPKEYVSNNKVKKLVGETTEEVEITYEEYNDTSYKILTGAIVGDTLESY